MSGNEARQQLNRKLGAVLVSAPTRLHITLCDLARATPRAYGGVGFALDQPRVETRVSRGRGCITLPEHCDQTTLDSVQSTLSRLGALNGGEKLDVEVETLPLEHTGLGTKTALLLSIVSAANILLDLGLSNRAVQGLSGRGGTSGVGIHTFFQGGIVWDAGHPQEEIERLGPSRYHRPSNVAPCLRRLDFPSEWAICIISPVGALTSGQQELDLFTRVTPLPVQETLELMGWVTHGLIPALVGSDLALLAHSLTEIASRGFKARELAEQPSPVQNLLKELQAQSIPSGMSSLGPTIFAISHARDKSSQARIEEISRLHGASSVWTYGDNQGAGLSQMS